jgi:putative iron-dependent peroxidase
MTTLNGSDQVPLAQSVLAPLTRAAIFLVLTVKSDTESYATVRSFCGDLSGIIRAVEFRDIDAGLTCIAAFGSDIWDRLFGDPRPAELHPFREFHAGNRHAPATPGDILFHIRAQRMDICFELATQIMDRIGDAVSVADEVQGFRYFEDRDLIGFVDGTENPRGTLALQSTLVGEEDAPAAGGSYVLCRNTSTI